MSREYGHIEVEAVNANGIARKTRIHPKRQKFYEKIMEAGKGGDVTFTPYEFALYILIKPQLTPELLQKDPKEIHQFLYDEELPKERELSVQLGFSQQYITERILFTSTEVPTHISTKLAYLSNKDEEFWKKPSHSAAEAEQITLHLSSAAHIRPLSHVRRVIEGRSSTAFDGVGVS